MTRKGGNPPASFIHAEKGENPGEQSPGRLRERQGQGVMAARRRTLTSAQVTARLRSGAALNLQFIKNKPAWTLSGDDVAPEIVSSLINRAWLEPAGDSLLDDGLSQTWRIPSSKVEVK
jgi:hypothetical protein